MIGCSSLWPAERFEDFLPRSTGSASPVPVTVRTQMQTWKARDHLYWCWHDKGVKDGHRRWIVSDRNGWSVRDRTKSLETKSVQWIWQRKKYAIFLYSKIIVALTYIMSTEYCEPDILYLLWDFCLVSRLICGCRSPQRRHDRADSLRRSRDYKDRRGHSRDRDGRRHRFFLAVILDSTFMCSSCIFFCLLLWLHV